MEFVWRPGHGPDEAALARMAGHFPKPEFVMGEAWFLTQERKMYPEMVSTALEDLPVNRLVMYFEEIGSGTSAFGQMDGEWSAWFHYLLPRLVQSSQAAQRTLYGALAEDMISAFITHYPDEANGAYPEFRQDALNTLGQWLMAQEFWEDGDLRPGTALAGPPEEGQIVQWLSADGSISATLFFCWKYLRPDEIDAWAESLFAIKGAHWAANLMVWLVGVLPVFSGEVTQPVEFGETPPDIGWATTHYLNGRYDGDYQSPTTIPFLSRQNIDAFQTALRKYVTTELFFEWLDAFAAFDYLKTELYRMPDQFAEIYLASPE